jgi:hypothetical protein
MAMLRFALDESASKRVFSVTGVLSSVALWDRLEQSWNQALVNADPKLRAFHMTDFESRKPPFGALKDMQRTKLISALVDAINAIGPMVFSARLELSISDAVLPATIRPEDKSKLLYVTCFMTLYSELYRWLRDKTIFDFGPVPLVLDRNRDVHHMITSVDAAIRNSKPEFDELLGPLVFDGRERCVPLQVADVFAYEIMKDLDNRILANGKTRKSYQRLMKAGSIVEFSEHGFRSLIERITHGEFRLSPSGKRGA